MEIILKNDVPNLGYKDDIVNVKNGYALNYLIPQGLAITATGSAMKSHKEIMKQRAHKEEKIKQQAQEMAEYTERYYPFGWRQDQYQRQDLRFGKCNSDCRSPPGKRICHRPQEHYFQGRSYQGSGYLSRSYPPA